MVNWCSACFGAGRTRDSNHKWWQFWRSAICLSCGGDGRAKPGTLLYRVAEFKDGFDMCGTKYQLRFYCQHEAEEWITAANDRVLRDSLRRV